MKKIVFHCISKLCRCVAPLLVCVGSPVLVMAQDDVLIVDANRIRGAYEQLVPDMVTARPDCHFEELRRTAVADITSERLAAITRHKMLKRHLSYEEVYRQVCRSTYVFGRYYRCPDCHNMHTMSSATAFALSEDGIMATNYHVLEDVLTLRRDTTCSDSAYFVADMQGNCFLLTKVLAYSRADDLAVFQVDTQGKRIDCIPLGRTAPTGSHVNIVANPDDLFYEYTEGVVTRNYIESSRRREIQRMEVSAGYAVGASGGPIVDDCGNMVGMVSSTNTLYSNPYGRDEHRDPQMVVKVSIPVACMKRLLRIE